MKKTIMTIAIVLGLGMASFANPGGGLFQRGASVETKAGGDDPAFPALPGHNSNTNANAPLGTGIVVLLGLGAAYLIGKKRNEE